MHHSPSLILATSSRYKIELLKRLQIPFLSVDAEIDETPQSGESVENMVSRLALAKANAVAKDATNSWVIGADQSAEIDGEILTKPGDYENAFKQLKKLNGRAVVFQTAVAVVQVERGISISQTSKVTAKLRQLDDEEIRDYLLKEQPYDCVGSFKCEALGISLFDAIESDDPTSLIGLPLILVSKILRISGYHQD